MDRHERPLGWRMPKGCLLHIGPFALIPYGKGLSAANPLSRMPDFHIGLNPNMGTG
jgi:hypothetical protein